MTSSTCSGSSPSAAARTTWSARSNAVVSRSVPRPAVPIGGRSADTSTASGMSSLPLGCASENAILLSKRDTSKTGRACMQISGCAAIVTGGTGGMGEATVRRLHAAGAKVVVADVADEKGKALKQELGVRYVRADATSEAEVRAAMAQAAELGPLRISVDAHGGPATGGRLVGRD